MEKMKKHRFIDPKTQKSYVFWIRADFNPGNPSLTNLLSASRAAYCEHDKTVLRSPEPFEEIMDGYFNKPEVEHPMYWKCAPDRGEDL